MYSVLQVAKRYLQYYLTASNGKGHGIHSPFVFDFVLKVLNDNVKYDTYPKIESLRTQLLQDQNMLEIKDLGAGSVGSNRKQRKISSIARHALKPKKFGQLLFRMVQYYQPRTIIELGSSLGITTSYLALGNSMSAVISLEGASTVAAIARSNFEKAGIKNIRLIEGNFDDTLPEVLASIKTADFVFVDGNHRMVPTLHYFELLLGKINNASILIFDDIHWSPEMEKAWEIIKAHPLVTMSIDLFFIGLVLFRDEFRIKQHFVIKY